MKNDKLFERGSEWRQWDLHIHTPASFHWKGKKFDSEIDSTNNRELVDEMINALNNAKPEVFALMDYWTFDGWFALKKRLSEPDAPKLLKTVFPGIELRLMAPMTGRLNAHVLFSDETPDQILNDFKASLIIESIDRPLSNDALITLARKTAEDKLKTHGFSKSEIEINNTSALNAGSTIAEINCDSYKKAIDKVPNGQAVGFMPYDTSDGLTGVKWKDNYAYFLGLFKTSPIFESRNLEIRDCFVGEITSKNENFIANFQKGLSNIPRLVVAGSDAHSFVGTANDNDKRGYGDFPSGKATWIKADPTFLGLLHAIKEPAKRSYIGELPPKIAEINENKGFFIEKIEINTPPNTATSGSWLDGISIPLNSDLIAIIGNKGSGKSALADVIALSGNSKQKLHFSFLKKDRFRGKSGDPAKNFTAKMIWHDKVTNTNNLNDDPQDEKVELVRYIPQGHFEDLCNAHVYGKSNAFENELRSVIFSHADEKIRLGALDFNQLIEKQESGLRDQLNEYRKDLSKLNQVISGIEEQLQPEVIGSLRELLIHKKRQIEEHKKNEPEPVGPINEEVSPEQKNTIDELSCKNIEIKKIDEISEINSTKISKLASKIKSIENIRERIKILERSYKQFLSETEMDLANIAIKPIEIIGMTINEEILNTIAESIPKAQIEIYSQEKLNTFEKQKLSNDILLLREKLNAPQLLHQKRISAIAEWNERNSELIGNEDAPDSLTGLNSRIEQIETLPKTLEENREKRRKLSWEIFEILNSQRKAREGLFKPVQDLIRNNKLIRDEYKLQFQATLIGSPTSIGNSLFSLIKQNTGEFRGEDESHAAIKKLTDQCNFSEKNDVINFIDQLNNKISAAASQGKNITGIKNLLRKEKSSSEVYDLIFGLSFMEPRYTLMFQDAQIEQLSPGQRGALLLIFYLLVDKGRNPIILDQPEENLDNETVVSLLVPVLNEAKKYRQIIMVTHNPNLAVVCDAEQVICSTFDRKNNSTISYISGSIENPSINSNVVNVLEGTMSAFSNRSSKYH